MSCTKTRDAEGNVTGITCTRGPVPKGAETNLSRASAARRDAAPAAGDHAGMLAWTIEQEAARGSAADRITDAILAAVPRAMVTPFAAGGALTVHRAGREHAVQLVLSDTEPGIVTLSRRDALTWSPDARVIFDAAPAAVIAATVAAILA